MYFHLHAPKQIDAKFINMKIYIRTIHYCQFFVFKIADIRLDVLHINSKTNEINKKNYHKIPMNAYC